MGDRMPGAVERSRVRGATSNRRLGAVLLAGSWLVPGVCSVVALALADGGYHPSADIALIELHVRDVGTEEVLLGPYSRFGWSHPGPMLYYLLALPYRLLGSGSAGIAVGAVLVNTGALTGITAVAWRRGGPMVGALAFTLSGLTVRALGPQFMRDPWNPHVPVLPFALLLLTAWSLAVGKRWALPAAAVLASFVTQSHVGYAPATAAVVVVALVGFVRSRPVRPLLPAALAAAIVGLLWLPPALEEVIRQPGNLRSLLDFYSQDRATSGLGPGLRAIALQLGPVPEWFVGRRPTNPFSGAVELPATSVPVALIPFAFFAVLAHRRGWRDVRWLVGLVIVVTVAAIASMSRVVGGLLPYLTVWTWIVGVMAWFLVGVAASRWVREVKPALSGPITAAFVVAGVALLLVNSVSAARVGIPTGDESRIVGELGASVRAHLPEDVEVVHVAAPGSSTGAVYWSGLVLELERGGRRVEAGTGDAAAFGRHRVTCTEGATTLVVTVDEEARVAARDRDLELLGRAGTLSAAEHDRLRRARDRVMASAASMSGEELIRQVQAIPDPGLEVEIYRDGTRRCAAPSD